MKIAYLIQAHNNYKHLQRLINALDDGLCNFFIHIDKKAAMPQLKGDNIFFIEERVKVSWAGFSQVRATLRLMKTACKKDHDYYALISGVDYPFKPNAYLQNLLQQGKEYIDIHEGYGRYVPRSRFSFYYFTDYYNRRNRTSLQTKFFMLLQQMLRKTHVKKSIPFKIYHGASWFVLTDACVKYILQTVKANNRFLSFFRFALSPDEAFFQTIIGNSSFLRNTKPFLTYADWNASPGPAILSGKHLEILKAEPYKFFARKFTDGSEEIIATINRELRTKAGLQPDAAAT